MSDVHSAVKTAVLFSASRMRVRTLVMRVARFRAVLRMDSQSPLTEVDRFQAQIRPTRLVQWASPPPYPAEGPAENASIISTTLSTGYKVDLLGHVK